MNEIKESEESLISKIIQEIENNDLIICHRHINPDGDAFGSQLGLKKLIKLNWPNKKVYAVGTQPERFQCLGLMDEIGDEMYQNALVLITDTGSIPRVEDQRSQLGKKVIKIDHHPNENQFGDLQWVDSSYTSASEMVGQLARIAQLKIDIDVAQTLMFGIITDSNRFGIENVSSTTFAIASYLMNPHWNINEVYQKISQKKVSFLQAEAEVIRGMKNKNGVGALFLTAEMMEKYQIPFDQNDLFTNLLEGIAEVQVRVVFSANLDGTYRVEFRSDVVPIKQVAEKYGGGGHKLICGATIKDLTITTQIMDDLSLAIQQHQLRSIN